QANLSRNDMPTAYDDLPQVAPEQAYDDIPGAYDDLPPAPRSAGENLFWNITAGALKPFAHPLDTLEDINAAGVEGLKKVGVYGPDVQPTKLFQPALSPEQIHNMGEAIRAQQPSPQLDAPQTPRVLPEWAEKGAEKFQEELGSGMTSPEMLLPMGAAR